jgi:hypothetical protein
MIATGSYAVRAAEPLSFVKSPEKGTPGVKVTLRLEAGPDKGAHIEWIGWLTDATTARTSESLALLGYDGNDPASVMTKEAIGVIEHEEYTKKSGEKAQRPRVAWINDPTGGGRMDPMTPAETAGAKERLKAAFAAAKAKAGKPVDPADEPRF